MVSNSTSYYYDNVTVQYIDRHACPEYDHKPWRVQRHLSSPKFYRTKEEAYQAAIQLYFDALVEENGGEDGL